MWRSRGRAGTGHQGSCAPLSCAGELTCGESCTWSSWCEGCSCSPGLDSPHAQRRLVPLALEREEKKERDCHGFSPRQSSGLPACNKQGGPFQLTPQKNPSSLPIVGQHLLSHFCAWAGGGECGDMEDIWGYGTLGPWYKGLTQVQDLLRGGCSGCPVFEHQPMGWMSG